MQTTRPERRRPRLTRASAIWLATTTTILLLALLNIFILGNSTSVEGQHLGFAGPLPGE
jgi:uncharacterized integral membrane protein